MCCVLFVGCIVLAGSTYLYGAYDTLHANTFSHHPRGSSHSYRSSFQTLFAEMGFADIVLRVSNFLEKVRLLFLSKSDLLVYRIRPVPEAGRHGRTNVLGVRVA